MKPADQDREIRRLREQLEEQDHRVAELGRSLARMRDHRSWYDDQWKLEAELRAERAEARVAAMEGSWAWRIGSAITWLPGKVKRMVKSGE